MFESIRFEKHMGCNGAGQGTLTPGLVLGKDAL
jgi:hypothetical protein